MKNLKDNFTAILDACKSCVEVGEGDDPISTGLGFEEDDLRIRLCFLASECYRDEDTGPRFRVSVQEISGSYIINEEGDEEEIPETELQELSAYIEKELPSLLED